MIPLRMSPTCCARSYAGSMRLCPRCSKWICHHCGVIAHGALVCADCSVKPPERISDELAFSALRFGIPLFLTAALISGLVGGVLGGLACVGLSIFLGPWAIGVGLLPGLGARLGVRAGARGSRGCGWTVLAAATTIPGYLLAVWISVVVILNAELQPGSEARVRLFDRRVFHALFHLWSPGLLAPVLVGLVLAILAATIPVKRH